MIDLNELYKRVNVSIGRDCQISPFCSLENVEIGNNVIIKDGCQLKNVVLGDGTRVARNVTAFSGEENRPIQIGRYVQVCYGIYLEGTGGRVTIGDHVGLGVMDMIYTGTGGCSFSPIMGELFPTEAGDIVLKDHSWIPSRVTLLPGVTLNEGTVIAPHSVVKRGVYEAWTLYGGSPARFIRKLDAEIIKRAKMRLNDYVWASTEWKLREFCKPDHADDK